MNRCDSIQLFESIYPGFFELANIRELPENCVCDEMILPLEECMQSVYEKELNAGISFGYFVGKQEELVAAVETKGLRGETKVTVRIPEDSMPEVMIQRGDYIVRGAVETISKQADLDGLEYFSVLSVGDNRRSQRKDLRHWVVSGA